MIDLNYSLRVAYKAALSSLSVPSYYQNIPNNTRPDAYIIFGTIRNNDDSTKTCSQTETFISLEIYTKSDIVNQGISADTIARDVFNVIYPNRNTQLQIDGGQILQTELFEDSVPDVEFVDGVVYLIRTLVFKHIIYQKADIS